MNYTTVEFPRPMRRAAARRIARCLEALALIEEAVNAVEALEFVDGKGDLDNGPDMMRDTWNYLWGLLGQMFRKEMMRGRKSEFDEARFAAMVEQFVQMKLPQADRKRMPFNSVGVTADAGNGGECIDVQVPRPHEIADKEVA